MTTPPVRLLHFSDVHVLPKKLGWTLPDALSKKAAGWINIRLLGRGRRFRHAPDVVRALRHTIVTSELDHLVFSGDATMLAFESEFRYATELLGLTDDRQPPGFAVPGNHDRYTLRAERGSLFERHFAAWQTGQRVDEQPYPFARKVGHVWLIGVNSSQANPRLWDASGLIGDEQLARLETLCSRLEPGPRILVTHYPLRTAHGELERRTHRLRDHAAALSTARRCKIALWLHGHIHKPYVLPASEAIPFPVVCAGSCTQTNRWSHVVYEITGTHLRAVRRTYQPNSQEFTDTERFELVLPEG